MPSEGTSCKDGPGGDGRHMGPMILFPEWPQAGRQSRLFFQVCRLRGLDLPVTLPSSSGAPLLAAAIAPPVAEATAASTRLPALDGLRGIAVLVVFGMHTIGLPRGGAFGVDMFFALSGFLITSQLLAELQREASIDIGRFYWRRCKRLLPAFLAACVLYGAISLCFPRSAAQASLFDLLPLLVTANLHWAQGKQPVPLMQHCWSLAVEWQFYLAWPLLLLAGHELGLRKRGLLVTMAIGVLLVWWARWRGDQYLRFDGLLLGAMLPLLLSSERFKRVVSGRHATWLLFMLPALLLLVMILRSPPTAHAFGGAAASIATCLLMLYVIVREGALSRALLRNDALRHCGRISYGLYLYHFPLAALMFINGFTPVQLFIVGLLVAVPMAEASWRLIEQPLLERCARGAA